MRWQLLPKIDQELQDRFPEINPITLQLLKNRGLTSQEAIDEFFNPDYTQDIHDPFLFNEMERAVKRIIRAIEKKEKILIYGDYDADGVTSSILLVTTLKKLGAKDLEIYIPHRLTEGYGLSLEVIDDFVVQGINLIITVDCGISNKTEIAKAQEHGIEVIIVDHHHEPAELPPAQAILTPALKEEKYPFKDLAGVGVAFKLAQGLFDYWALEKKELVANFDAFEKWLLDLVALGTVGDCVPLLGENRTLVKYGLLVLNKTQRVGLQKLIEIARLKRPTGLDNFNLDKSYNLNTYNISFQLVPRLNAAGRIDHANVAYQLLMTQDQGEAQVIAQELEHANQERQKLTEEILKDCQQQIKDQVDDKILICLGQGWSAGLIGLVAGKLTDQYYKPVLVFGQEENKFVASGRSIKEFNLIEAVEKLCRHLDRFGGHAQACGLTIEGEENYLKFVKKIKRLAKEQLKDIELKLSLLIDIEIELAQVNWDLYDEIEKFEPFGEGNPRVLLLIKNLKVVGWEKVGSESQHLRLMVSDKSGGVVKKAMSFGTAFKWGEKLSINDIIDLVIELGTNIWNGQQELQIKVVDLRKQEV